MIRNELSRETGETPVRARRRKVHTSYHCPHRNATVSGKVIGCDLRRPASEVPSRNIGTFIADPDRGRRFSVNRKIQFKGDFKYENKTHEKINVIHPLYGAYCGYGTFCNGL